MKKLNTVSSMSAAKVAKFAHQAITECDYDRQAAAEKVVERATDDPAFFQALMQPYLRRAAWEVVRKIERKRPRTKKPEPVQHSPVTADGNAALAAVATRNWLDKLLPNGQRLAGAARPDLIRASDHHKEKARVDSQHAAFYRTLAQNVGNQTVAEKWGHDQLARLAVKFGLSL